jgi:hypothetical protein
MVVGDRHQIETHGLVISRHFGLGDQAPEHPEGPARQRLQV